MSEQKAKQQDIIKRAAIWRNEHGEYSLMDRSGKRWMDELVVTFANQIAEEKLAAASLPESTQEMCDYCNHLFQSNRLDEHHACNACHREITQYFETKSLPERPEYPYARYGCINNGLSQPTPRKKGIMIDPAIEKIFEDAAIQYAAATATPPTNPSQELTLVGTEYACFGGKYYTLAHPECVLALITAIQSESQPSPSGDAMDYEKERQ